MEGNRAVQKQVTVGLVNTDYAEIVSGLSEGDVVVLDNQASGNNRFNIPGMNRNRDNGNGQQRND
jgi:hypothetical protein